MRNVVRMLGLFALLACAHQVQVPLNRYGLSVVEDIETYRRLVEQNPAKRLVDLSAFIPGLRLDIRYATSENFMKRKLYPVAKAYLRLPAATALRQVQRELASKGLALKVFDGYRPYSVTEMMWEPYKNPDFVADPAKGSRHNRGCAVDLTLIDLVSGQELSMPTPYDDSSTAAAYANMNLTEEVLQNRQLLRETMERHGFTALASEWWHFDFAGWKEFELMNVGLNEITAEH